MALNKLISLDLLKVFKAEVDKLLLKKADTTYVDEELGKKATTEALTQAQSTLTKAIETAKTEAIAGAGTNTDTKVGELRNELTPLIEEKVKKADIMEGNFIKASVLPSFVDDVLEFENRQAFDESGEAGKIYVDKETNKTYRWSGSAYVEISASLALGETAGTAYEGDKGKALADKVATLEETTIPGINGKVQALETKSQANADAITKLNGAEDVEGSVAKAVKDVVDPVSAVANKAKEDLAKVVAGTTVVPKATHAVNADSATNAASAAKVANALTIAGSTFDGSEAVTVALKHTHIGDFDASVVAVDLKDNVAVKKVATDLAQHIANVESGASVAVDGTTIVYINGEDEQHKKLAVGAIEIAKVTDLQAELNKKLNSADVALATTEEIKAIFTAQA